MFFSTLVHTFAELCCLYLKSLSLNMFYLHMETYLIYLINNIPHVAVASSWMKCTKESEDCCFQYALHNHTEILKGLWSSEWLLLQLSFHSIKHHLSRCGWDVEERLCNVSCIQEAFKKWKGSIITLSLWILIPVDFTMVIEIVISWQLWELKRSLYAYALWWEKQWWAVEKE